MYKTARLNDGKNAGGGLKVEFQGKELQNCKDLLFWFLWGDYTFDIREVRTYLNRKSVKRSLDLNAKMHPCTRFEQQMGEIIDAVGDQDFEKVLLACAKQTEEHKTATGSFAMPDREVTVIARNKNHIAPDDDDFPF